MMAYEKMTMLRHVGSAVLSDILGSRVRGTRGAANATSSRVPRKFSAAITGVKLKLIASQKEARKRIAKHKE